MYAIIKTSARPGDKTVSKFTSNLVRKNAGYHRRDESWAIVQSIVKVKKLSEMALSLIISSFQFNLRVFSFVVPSILLTLNWNSSRGQPVPTGSPVFEESLRRAQLLGLNDSSTSFMIRPIFPRKTTRLSNAYLTQNLFNDIKNTDSSSTHRSFLKGKGEILLLPPAYQIQTNSRQPYGWGDGAMIPNRGYQHIINAGAYIKIGALNVVFRPEWVYAQNKDFERFPITFSPEIQAARYHHWVTADPPERFGTSEYSRATIGQSSISLDIGPFELGASNQNVWWGPSQFNSLIFSNNSRGFEHLTFSTRRPIKTFIGIFESQLVMGRLMPADFIPVYGDGVSISKDSDWRYLSGISINYNPKWIKGLFLGASRTFQLYHSDISPSFWGYFPIFEAFQKQSVGLAVDDLRQDQQIAIYLRWLFQKANAEFYFEFGRGDHALDWRDFVMSPEHTRAFIFGFSKLFKICDHDHIQVRFEVTQSQQSINHLLRYGAEGDGQSWGAHIPVLQGSTHYGQQLGNGVGPGNNAQTLEVAWAKDIRKLGIMFERVENQMDFFNRAFRDNSPARPWVDISTGLVGHWRFNRLVANARIQFIRSLNYQWQQDFIYPGNQNAKGVDRFNLHSYMGVSYLF
jgi:hypothetical protein